VGIDPKGVKWQSAPKPMDSMTLFVDGKADAFMGSASVKFCLVDIGRFQRVYVNLQHGAWHNQLTGANVGRRRVNDGTISDEE